MQKLAKDLTVDLGADRPGAIAKATEAIAKAGSTSTDTPRRKAPYTR